MRTKLCHEVNIQYTPEHTHAALVFAWLLASDLQDMFDARNIKRRMIVFSDIVQITEEQSTKSKLALTMHYHYGVNDLQWVMLHDVVLLATCIPSNDFNMNTTVSKPNDTFHITFTQI
jgi:hypothetical protein